MLRSAGRYSLRYAFMWVNQDWGPTGDQNYSEDALYFFIDYLETIFFRESNYLKIDGKPVIYIYNIDRSEGGLKIDSSGNILSNTVVYNRLQTMRGYAQMYGYEDLYIVGMGDGDYDGCGFDAITNYSHAKWAFDQNYSDCISGAHPATSPNIPARWATVDNANDAKFIPTVPVNITEKVWTGGSYIHTGMDSSTLLTVTPVSIGRTALMRIRRVRQPFIPIPIISETCSKPPEITSTTTRATTERIVMINAWNEWGEGNAIEPSQQYGWGYLQNLREVMGYNLLQNPGIEVLTSPWNSWVPGEGFFTTYINMLQSKWTGFSHGVLIGATAANTCVYQIITSDKFTIGSDYRAWCKIKTTNVAGNGARLRVSFRNSSGGVLYSYDSTPVTGSSGDFQIVSLSGQIPNNVNINKIFVEIVGSTDQGPGATSMIEFDDVVFKTTKAAANDWPTATITASDTRITGSGTITINWSTTNCATAQIYCRVNNGNTEALAASGASGSNYFSGTAGNVYTLSIYEGTNHTRLLNSVTIVFHPESPSHVDGLLLENLESGPTGTITYSADVSNVSVTQGTMRFYTIGTDPHFRTTRATIDTTRWKVVRFRMKVNHVIRLARYIGP